MALFPLPEGDDAERVLATLEYRPDRMGRTSAGTWRPRAKAHETFTDDDDEYVDRLFRSWRNDRHFDDYGARLFLLKGPVGDGGDNHRRDVAKVQTLLERLGHYDLAGVDGPTGDRDENLDRAIRRYQKSRTLKVDGRIDPDGPTLATILTELSAEPRDHGPGRAASERLSSIAHNGVEVVEEVGTTPPDGPDHKTRAAEPNRSRKPAQDDEIISDAQPDEVKPGTQVAAIPIAVWAATAGIPLIGAAALYAQRQIQEALKRPGIAPPTVAPFSGGPMPPPEPLITPRLEPEKPQLEGFPAGPPAKLPSHTGQPPPKMPDGSITAGPLLEPIKPEPQIFEALADDDPLRGPQISYLWGSPNSQKITAHFDAVGRKIAKKLGIDVEVYRGNFERSPDGKKEMWLRPKEVQDEADRRHGGSFIDLAFVNEKTGRRVLVSIFTPDSEGNPDSRERRQSTTAKTNMDPQDIYLEFPKAKPGANLDKHAKAHLAELERALARANRPFRGPLR